MVQKWISELKSKTGRSLDEWIAVVTKEGPKDYQARRTGSSPNKNSAPTALGGSPNVRKERAPKKTRPKNISQPLQYVDAQYAGAKTNLRPIYDVLLELSKSLGPDVKACPCKTMVPLYRQHIFAQIKPTTNSRIDLGLCFTTYKGKLPKRLVDTGGLAKKIASPTASPSPRQPKSTTKPKSGSKPRMT